MPAIDDALSRLRESDPVARAGIPNAGALHDGLRRSEVAFAALGGGLEERWHAALGELAGCIGPLGGVDALFEGGAYPGAWLESTATVSAEILDRFAPSITRATHLLFADLAREDGLLPYKVTSDGAAFTQIQMVTPLARSVWHHYLRSGPTADAREYLRRMYDAMARNDAWLAQHRDTRGTGGVEAFCTFDTGHDLSPRFWHVPERCFRGDAARFDPDVPGLPYVAPDLTANVACQREHLALIAAELGEDGTPWQAGAAASSRALFDQCWDESDGMFYDRTTDGHVRVASDVLLRVLACGIGDDELFGRALERHLMNTRRFLSQAGFTSIAMDDPRFDDDHTRNSWAGPVNLLSLVRAPQAFEAHGRHAELSLVRRALLGAVAGHDRFAQCLDPWTGDAGYTDGYSPAMLWLLDALEADCGVLPRADGEVWLSGMPPTRLDHGRSAVATAAARTVAGTRYELAADDERVEVHRNGRRWLRFPRGWRVVLDRTGRVSGVVGLSAASVSGELRRDAAPPLALTLGPNDHASVADGHVTARRHPGFTPPRF
ncbi:MGH1-like glycoside hydrolase domain-containing protein [Microbacterium jejuense]|uniref:MGH1-like glycoside hydrolase domain-containing protein n=1 Tax=Microbacterium jejuense TaxID=1263637 RepID=UPI0031EB30AB